MATYKFTTPGGKNVSFQSDTPPTEQQLNEYIAAVDKTPAPSKRPQSEMLPSHTPARPVAEIRADTTPKWKYWLADNLTPLMRSAGSIAGGVGGAALTAEAAGLGAFKGAAIGGGIGHQGAEVIKEALNVPRNPEDPNTPSEQALSLLNAIGRSGAEELVGQGVVAAGSKALSKYASPKVTAGEVLRTNLGTGGTRGAEREFVENEAEKLVQAKTGLGVTKELPAVSAPNIRTPALVNARASGSNANPTVRATENIKAKEAQEAIESGLNVHIPSTNEAAVKGVRDALEKRYASETEAITASKIKPEATSPAPIDPTDLEGRLAASDFDKQEAGRAVQERFTGEGKGRNLVKQAFDEEYTKFDNTGVEADANKFMTALKGADDRSVQQGGVLSNYLGEGGIIKKRIESLAKVDGDGKAVLPESLPLSQWRGIKGDLAQAAEDEAARGNYAASRQLKEPTRQRGGNERCGKAR
jgi:hypothetical protein